MSSFKHFYRRPISERVAILNEYLEVDSTPQLLPETADQMIENYVYSYELPLGVLPSISVNGKVYVVPMATEEPSVIAAASNGAKRLGNIQSLTTNRELVGQIVLLAKDKSVAQRVECNKEELLTIARQLVPNMVQRGGGPTRIWTMMHDSFTTIYVALDPCDAMGANVMNTLLEGLSPYIQELTGCEAILNILSNYQPESTTTASVSIPLDSTGRDIAQRIALASEYAQLDVYRAVTHNKGIMNGIDAVAVATGNDWRAIEAGIHAFASRSGRYKGLSRWIMNDRQETLDGILTVPLPVATVGGTLSVHPTAKRSLSILRCETASELADVMAAVGLAQNFAALRALVTEGIQKGHMSMQARSLALQVGATMEEVPLVVEALKKQVIINSSTAKEILNQLRQ